MENQFEQIDNTESKSTGTVSCVDLSSRDTNALYREATSKTSNSNAPFIEIVDKQGNVLTSSNQDSNKDSGKETSAANSAADTALGLSESSSSKQNKQPNPNKEYMDRVDALLEKGNPNISEWDKLFEDGKKMGLSPAALKTHETRAKMKLVDALIDADRPHAATAQMTKMLSEDPSMAGTAWLRDRASRPETLENKQFRDAYEKAQKVLPEEQQVPFKNLTIRKKN